MGERPAVNNILRRMRYRCEFALYRSVYDAETGEISAPQLLTSKVNCSTPLPVQEKEYARVKDLPTNVALYRAFAVAEDLPAGIETGDTIDMKVVTHNGKTWQQRYTVVRCFDEVVQFKLYLEPEQTA